MKRIKKRRKLTAPTKIAKDFIGFGIMTGIGTHTIGKVGGSSAGYMQSQLGQSGLAGYTPIGISLGMGQHLIGQVRIIKKRVKKKR